jgi:oxygen-independent coproporphyrinogen-3 oxidase
LSCLNKFYNLTNDCEITIEGRVTGFTTEKMQACIDNGVNRFSIGIQAFDSQLRHSIGRLAKKNQAIKTLRELTNFNQASVVIDLLYGIPGQTMAQWFEDQNIVSEEVEIDGLDHYKLSLTPSMPIMQDIDSGKIPAKPTQSTCYNFYQAGEELMAAIGAVRLSIKHYALTYRERNANNDISGSKSTCLPFGLCASGRVGDYLFYQEKDLATYSMQITAGIKPFSWVGLTPPEYKVCRKLAAQINRNRSININKAVAKEQTHRARIIEHTTPLLSKWQEDALLHPTAHPAWLKLSSQAMFNHKQLAMELMDCVALAYKDQ